MQSVARAISFIGMIFFASGTLISNYSLAEGNNKAANQFAPGKEILIPDAGLNAHMQGLEVVLNKDGTWRLQDRTSLGAMIAITDTGDTVKLHFSQDEKGGIIRSWEYFGKGAGPIQIVVSHTTSTAMSLHSRDDNCIPTVKVRNLSALSLSKLVFEIEFVATNGERSGLSSMIGPLDDGEEKELIGPALLVKKCEGLDGRVKIPFCLFNNGGPCSSAVKASEYGAIPLRRIDINPEDAKAAR